ncbi:MAG: lactonase family protein [Spirochaetales bacterium]|nr:lactonase family protein [Spirochaetales bacterium]
MLFYCGSYNKKKHDPGIFICDIREQDKSLVILGNAAGGKNLSWLLLDEQKLRLYAVNEIDSGSEQAAVSVFRVSPGGRFLAAMGSHTIPGKGPCHLALSTEDSMLFTADYASGTVSMLELNDDGLIAGSDVFIAHEGAGHDPVRQEAPHIHAVYVRDHNLWCIDLGLDQIVQYPFAGRKRTEDYATKYMFEPGAGPRMMEFGPARQIFVVEELKNRISVLSREGTDYEYSQMISTLPEDWQGDNKAGHIVFNQDKSCLYASNRGHDSIAVFFVDPVKKELKLRQHYMLKGKGPRHFAISPDNNFLVAACQQSKTLECLTIKKNGTLTRFCSVDVPENPACILFF